MMSVEYAEHCAEMAGEAETKKEEAYWWREYRKAMIKVTGDPNLFRKKRDLTGRPSRDLQRTLLHCPCKKIQWLRKTFEYKDTSECSGCSSHNLQWKGGLQKKTCIHHGKDSGWQEVGPRVQFKCPTCGIETGWHQSNSAARDEWNELVRKGEG